MATSLYDNYFDEKMCSDEEVFNDCSLIISLNNEAATSLISGDVELSISTFCQALHTSKSCLGRRNEQRKQYQHQHHHHHHHQQQQQQRPSAIFNNYNSYYYQNEQPHVERDSDIHHNDSSLSSSSSSSSQFVPRFDISDIMVDFHDNDFDNNHNSANNTRGKMRLSGSSFSSFATASTNGNANNKSANNINVDEEVDRRYNSGEDLKSSSGGGLGGSGDFIYKRPIHVPTSYAHHVGLQRSEVILPSIVIFNLALAHHLWAMENNNEETIKTGSFEEERSSQQHHYQTESADTIASTCSTNNISTAHSARRFKQQCQNYQRQHTSSSSNIENLSTSSSSSSSPFSSAAATRARLHQQPQHCPSLLLKKAAKLYGLAIQLQEGQMVSEGPESYSKLFFLSCINNLGNTHRLLGDIVSSEKIFQQLLTMLMYLNYSEQQRGGENDETSMTIPAATMTMNNNNNNNNNNHINNNDADMTHNNIHNIGTVSRISESFFRNIFQTELNSAPAA